MAVVEQKRWQPLVLDRKAILSHDSSSEVQHELSFICESVCVLWITSERHEVTLKASLRSSVFNTNKWREERNALF